MSDNQDEDVQIRVSLETLAHQVAESWRQKLTTLRAGLDQQIASIEATLNEDAHSPVISTTVKRISHDSAARAKRARLHAEATAQALAAIETQLRTRLASETAANGTLRTALEDARSELKSAQESIARSETARKAALAQHHQILNDHKGLTSALDGAQAQVRDLQTQLKNAQRETEKKSLSLAAAEHRVQELAEERAGLLQRISNMTAAQATAEAQHRQLETVSQTLSNALSQMLRERKAGRTTATALPTQGASLHGKDDAEEARMKAAPSKRATSTNSTGTSPVSGQKKPLQFSQHARDAKRVKIRRGINVELDGVPGELVDLSLGGAQALLRQAVKPNQLVRLTIPIAAGQLICKGRIVWTVFERRSTSLSVYRTGIKFIDVDPAAVENFMNDYREDSPKKVQHSSGVA